MRLETRYGGYYEVRKVNSNQYEVFYCWNYNQKKGERMITSKNTLKLARETARQIKKIYEMNYLSMSH
ncbi:hypothetical protein C1N87_31525 (plasmid) [Priestia aryabhattai]